jgi:hypothetical protein
MASAAPIEPTESVDAPPAEDPEAAGHKGARSFLRGFAVTAFLLLGAVATASYLLDVTGVLGAGLVRPAQQTLRDDKSRFFEALPEKPAIVVLGSSRTWAIRPARITELTGKSAFSFCVDNNYIHDFLPIYSFVHEHGQGKLQRLLIGVDAELFQATKGGRLEYSRYLRGYAEPGVIPPLWQMMPQLLFGKSTISSDLRTLEQLATAKKGDKELLQNVSLPDGLVIWPRYDEVRRTGTYDLEAKLTWSLGNFKPAYRSFGELSPARIDTFRRLLLRARADGVAVDAFIPPLHPRGYKEILPLGPRTGDLRRLLATLETEGLLRFVRETRLQDFGGDPEGFYDFQHMMAENGDKLLTKVYGDPAAVGVKP